MVRVMVHLGTADGAVLRCLDIMTGAGRKRGCYTRDEVNELVKKLETAHQEIVEAAQRLEREEAAKVVELPKLWVQPV